MEEQLRNLKLKKARLWLEIESLSQISPLLFQNFGKVEAEIMKLEKELLRKTENTI